MKQMLTESFVIPNPNSHYAIRIANPTSSLLRHRTATANGFVENLNCQSLSSSVYEPPFHFIIDPSDSKLSISVIKIILTLQSLRR